LQIKTSTDALHGINGKPIEINKYAPITILIDDVDPTETAFVVDSYMREKYRAKRSSRPS